MSKNSATTEDFGQAPLLELLRVLKSVHEQLENKIQEIIANLAQHKALSTLNPEIGELPLTLAIGNQAKALSELLSGQNILKWREEVQTKYDIKSWNVVAAAEYGTPIGGKDPEDTQKCQPHEINSTPPGARSGSTSLPPTDTQPQKPTTEPRVLKRTVKPLEIAGLQSVSSPSLVSSLRACPERGPNTFLMARWECASQLGTRLYSVTHEAQEGGDKVVTAKELLFVPNGTARTYQRLFVRCLKSTAPSSCLDYPGMPHLLRIPLN